MMSLLFVGRGTLNYPYIKILWCIMQYLDLLLNVLVNMLNVVLYTYSFKHTMYGQQVLAILQIIYWPICCSIYMLQSIRMQYNDQHINQCCAKYCVIYLSIAIK